MTLIGLIGNLKTYKMEKKLQKKTHLKRRKLLPASLPHSSQDKDEQEDDENLSLLAKNVRKMHNKTKFNNQKRWQGKEERK